MKRRPNTLTKKETIQTLDALYTAAASVTGREATKLFLRDLLTSSERIMLGRRILIAQQLLRGRSYDDIQAEMKVGRSTIARIHRWLVDEFPGFEHAVSEIETEYKRRRRKHVQPFTFAWIRRKYPLHFLFFNIIEEMREKK